MRINVKYCGGILVASRKVQKRPVSVKKKVQKKNGSRTSGSKQIKSEASGLLIFSLGVLMALSIYFDNIVGPLGELFGKFTGGIFGLSAYVLPLIIVFHGLAKIFKPRLIYQDKRLSLILSLLVLFSAMLQAGLYDALKYENMTILRYLKTFYTEGVSAIGKGSEFLPSGGVVGGIIGVPLLFVFKKWGTMIILTTLAIIVAMLITRLSLAEAARSVARGTSDAISGIVDAARKKREVREIRKSIDSIEAQAAVTTNNINAPRKKRKRVLDFPIDNTVMHPGNTDSQVNPADSTQEIYMGDEPVLHDNKLNILDIKGNVSESDITTKLNQNITEDKNIELNSESVSAGNVSEKSGVSGQSIDDKMEHIDYSTGKRDEYIYPPIELLSKSKEGEKNMRRIRTTSIDSAKKLEGTLASFGIEAKIINVSVGPAFTRYELQPGPGVKVSRIVNLTDDIALNLAATGVRIEAPIPGKAAIGIEVPNKEVAPISLRSVLESAEFNKQSSHLSVALGKDITGENVVIDLAKMPHILIAGATGSGKSVCINSIIISLLYKAAPEDVKLLMIDPKVVELGVYNGIPHLLIPVVTDPNKAAGALRWAVTEMTTRYKLFAEKGVRDLLGYNALIDETGDGSKLPQIVIIIDELADLMMVAPHDVEDAICRLAQMARAAGMHLVIATQRPSVNVITGVIKANIPSRIAFAVSSQVDSRTIIDMGGAEKLLGKGDMLYYPVGIPKPVRVKGAFVTDKEVELVVDFVKNQVRAHYDEEIIENINDNVKREEESNKEEQYDELLNDAIEAVIDCGQASVSFIQRKFKVGYARAGRIIDQMAERNIISGYEGSKPRRVLISRDRWNEMKMSDPGDKV
ncbi:MAG TPA: DNA translocase FtsK [Clostridiaceae bacterium]|jgi:S-DNA-T family DNA segregation ATPase FtsK/SpoIIIE|nr:DNA translocase FtsK [Clostridiaceae bacterium]